MRQASTKLMHHIDCREGGKVWPDGTTLYVGHMHSPAGTTIGDEAFARIKSKLDAKLAEREA